MADDSTRGEGDVRYLQGCIDDLTSLQALGVSWTGQNPAKIAGGLLDVLVTMLQLDFAYARLSNSVYDSSIDFVRLPRDRHSSAPPRDIGRALDRWLTRPSPIVPVAVPNPVGAGEARIASLRLGLPDEIGLLLVGSKRADFPTQTETLLLRVVANQAVVALQEARRASERRQAAKELERQVVERTAQLGAVKDELAEELRAMTGLHALGTRLLAKTEIRPLLEEVLEATIILQNSDFGSVQLYHPETEELELVAQRGFAPELVAPFVFVNGDSYSACGVALKRNQRVLVEDVWTDPSFEPLRAFAAAAGFRATQSTPLFGRRGQVLGMLSTHFRQPHRPSERDLRLTDLYARQAAELIERQQAEEKLRESEQKYRTLFDSIDEGFCTIEVLFDANDQPLDFRYLEVNPSFENQTGIQNAPGQRARAIIPRLEDHWVETYGRIALTGESVRFESEAATLCRWFDVYAFRFGDPRERTVAALFSDITARKRAEADLRHSEAALHKTLTELAHATRITTMGELAASIAHEINQPLGAIVNNGNVCLRLLADPLARDDDARGALADIVHEAERASAIIARIRALTRRTVPERIWLQLRDVLPDVLALAHRELVEHGIEVRADLPPELPRVLADRVQLQQVFLNLIINSLEAMSTVEKERRVLAIGGQPGELRGQPAARIFVQDRGVGIASENLAHLFEAFFTTKPQGMGMGLRIAASIVEALGGQLSVAPNDGPGVTFSCLLPAKLAGSS